MAPVVLAGLLCTGLVAAPQGGQTVSGAATIDQQGATTTITTTSRNTILRFDTFDLTRDESVRFVQPDAGSRVLNKIAGSAPTRIDGSIWSNGTVYLVNPAGVMFGPNAVVDVGGFYAGAANLADSDFLQGIDRFDATGAVVNEGTINADHVALIGRRVANLGAIHAPDGMVALASGDRVMLSDRDRRIYIRIDAPADGEPSAAGSADSGEAGVTNTGSIDAGGGSVSWGAGDMYAMGLRQSASGSVRAERFEARAGQHATAELDGTVDVSNAAGRGGAASVTAGRVEVRGNIDASGATGGGTIHLGGERRGSGDLAHADVTRVHDSATLDASATTEGHGGEIIAYADRFNAFAGEARATGGVDGGDGGFVEVSGETLVFRGNVNVAAPAGQRGSLLFDPTDITIVDGGPGADDGDLPDLSDATVGAGAFEISEQALEALAADANLILEATNDITIQDITDDQIALPIDSTGSVTLTADLDGDGAGSIVFNDPNDTLLTEGGTIALTAADLVLGGLDTRGAAGTIADGAITIETSATNTILALGDDPGGNRLRLDAAELDAIFAQSMTLSADANVVIDNVPANATDSTPLLQISSADGDIRVINNPSTIDSQLAATAVSGDIDLFVPLTVAADASFEATDGDISLTNDAVIAPGNTVTLVADPDDSAGGTIQANVFDAGHIQANRVELISGTAIGAAGNPVELAGATEVVMDANGGVFVEGDGATSPTLFALAVDPSGNFVYQFDEFPDESLSGDANAIVRDANGDLFINTAEAAGGTSTTYSFVAKTGDLFVDDPSGDGGIFSGDGDVSLIAQAGSVLPETPRPDFNVRTNALADGPTVTLRALNAGGAGAHEASVGGDGTGENFFDVEGAANLVIDARDHANVRGSGQTLQRLALLVDPAAPGIDPDTPTYQVLNVDNGDGDGDIADMVVDITSDDTDLTINDLASETDADLEVTAYTGHLDVTRVRSAGGDIELTTAQEAGNRGDITLVEDAVASGGGVVTIRASAVPDGQGGLAAPANAPGVGDGAIALDVNAIDAGDGSVGLFAGSTIDESDADDTLQQVNITTTGQLFVRANGNIGGTASVGDATNPTESHLDIDAGSLNADSLDGGSIVIKDQGADGLTVERAFANGSGFVRVDSVGTLTVQDAAAISDGSFVWLASEADIVEPAGDDPTIPNAVAGGNVRFDSEGDIGDPNDLFDIEASGLFALVGQGAFGGTEGATGGIFVDNLTDTPDTEYAVFQLAVFDGDIVLETSNDMLIDGAPFFSQNRDPQFEPFEMDNPGDITLTTEGGGIITIQNADLDDPSGFDNFADFTANGPVVIALNQQFFQQATSGLLQGETATFNQSLTTEIPFQIDATGDVTVVGAAVFGGQAVLGGADFDFQSPVTLGGQTNIDGDNVTFNDTLATDGEGDHALSVNTADDGTTEFFAEVGGGGNPLFLLSTNADGLTRLHADVTTRGRQAYFDHLELAADVTLTDTASTDTQGGDPASLSGSGVFFNTVGSDGTPRDLTVVTETDPDALASLSPRVPVIGFGGDVGVDPAGDATAGARLNNLRLNPAGRPDVPAVASVVAGVRESDTATDIDPGAEIDFNIHVENLFEMAQNSKMTVIGDVTLNLNRAGSGAGNVVGRLSDINARGALTVDANGGDLVLLDHDPADPGLLRPEDRNANGQLDEFFDGRGLDFWGRDAIAINNAASLTTAGAGDATFVSTALANITGAGAFRRETVDTFPTLTRPFAGVNIALDPAVAPVFDLGAALPPLMPDVAELADAVRVPLTTPQMMAELNMPTRFGEPAEQLGKALGAATIDDLTLTPGQSPAAAALSRIREDAVPGALEAYRRTFYAPTEGPEGQTVWQPRFDELRQTLTEGIEAYRVATGEPPTSPRAFRTFFVESNPQSATLAVLDALRAVYLELYQLGLTEQQWSRLLYRLARPITPEGYSADFVNQAALGQGP